MVSKDTGELTGSSPCTGGMDTLGHSCSQGSAHVLGGRSDGELTRSSLCAGEDRYAGPPLVQFVITGKVKATRERVLGHCVSRTVFLHFYHILSL